MRDSPRSGGAQEGRVLYGIETNTRREAARDEERFLRNVFLREAQCVRLSEVCGSSRRGFAGQIERATSRTYDAGHALRQSTHGLPPTFAYSRGFRMEVARCGGATSQRMSNSENRGKPE